MALNKTTNKTQNTKPSNKNRNMDPEEIWAKLESGNKLDRDFGSQMLQNELSNDTIDGKSKIPQYINILKNAIDQEPKRWETKVGILKLAGILYIYSDTGSLKFVTKIAVSWISDEEVRVRIGG